MEEDPPLPQPEKTIERRIEKIRKNVCMSVIITAKNIPGTYGIILYFFAEVKIGILIAKHNSIFQYSL